MSLVLGSPLYMAPELVRRISYDNKVDIWALGCITYLMLSGLNPFQSRVIATIHKNTLHKKVTFDTEAWTNISPECKKFILDCLDRNALTRKSSKELLNENPWILKFSKIKPSRIS